MSKVAKALSRIPSFLSRGSGSGSGSAGSQNNSNNGTSNDGNNRPGVVPPAYLRAKEHDLPLLPPPLPEDEGKLTVVLDLDETLIHSKLPRSLQDMRQEEERKEETESYNDYFEVVLYSETIRVHKRPGLQEFLEEASKHYELICFTAGIQEYAQVLMDAIDPHRKYFRYRLFRQHCRQIGGSFVKDLSILNRPMERVVLVDNNAFSFLMQLGNGIPVSSFMDDANDTALYVLQDFLNTIREHPDVRCHLRDVFSLEVLLADCARLHLGGAHIEGERIAGI